MKLCEKYGDQRCRECERGEPKSSGGSGVDVRRRDLGDDRECHKREDDPRGGSGKENDELDEPRKSLAPISSSRDAKAE